MQSNCEASTSTEILSEIEFRKRQRIYFRKQLEDKWRCDSDGDTHTICVITKDGRAFVLDDWCVERWVDGLCSGRCTTANPPRGMFEFLGGGFIFNRSDGSMIISAVDIPPSRFRASVQYALRFNRSRRSLYSNHSETDVALSTVSLAQSEAAQGPGHHTGKALAILGQAVYFLVEDALIIKRANSYLRLLKQYNAFTVGIMDGPRILRILADALHMSL
ncbi:hypothetical protein M422DRAFT_47043 [Sphaerobolus stellatus SS14]|uniref:Uncharacterized protein n=1 Tax=Sphaerobolus stellatus (strain SS14) TaxID=990650 RepID=A0A0C9VS23_SPHS4|nr:hypothetical protein M422DRAFT_47043 [Sphaerobolus stellatus SS14]